MLAWDLLAGIPDAAVSRRSAPSTLMPLFVTKNGQTFGPHEPDEIAVFLGTGDFQPEDFCWQEGWSEWRPISTVLPPKPTPTAPSAVASAPPVLTPPLPRQKGQIPDDIEIVGTLKLPDDRTVTCKVDGEIVCPSTVTIGKEARIKARIKADSVVIFGTVEGDIHATGRAVLKSSSTLYGDIHAARVLVEEGATFNGKSHVSPKSGSTPPKSKQAQVPAGKRSTNPPSSSAAAKSPARGA